MNEPAKYRGAPVPDHILRKMSPEDRASLGKAGRTIEEITATNAVKCERDLHNQILQYVRLKGWIAFHGSMAHRTKRTVGEFDFCCLLPYGVVLFVECKTQTGKLTSEQAALTVSMRQLGHEMHLVRSLPEFLAICNQKLMMHSSLGEGLAS